VKILLPMALGVALIASRASPAEKSILAYLYQQWIVGYLSGVASATSQAGMDPLHGTDAEGVWAWIDNYCQAHPLDLMIDAGTAFVVAHPR
jgi:hypothetical protein